MIDLDSAAFDRLHSCIVHLIKNAIVYVAGVPFRPPGDALQSAHRRPRGLYDVRIEGI